MTGDALPRVLIVHNAYRQRGGEDVIAEAEAGLLRDAGVAVCHERISNREIGGVRGRMRAFAAASGNMAAAERMVEAARDHRADVVHFHNFFPLVSPAAHLAVASAGFPVVQTLHNYRLLCANGMLMRYGQPCELCLEGSRLNALLHRCYRGSVAGSAAVLRMQQASIRTPQWLASVDRFIALTEFARGKFADNGLPQEKITVLGNFVRDPGPVEVGEKRAGAIFVGRIAPGKGVELLCRAWESVAGLPLTIIGDGPLLDQCRALAPSNVTFTGRASREQVQQAMRQAQWLILPSTWYEGFPVVLAEAYANGLPVVAARIGGIPEIVRDGQSGLLFEPGDRQSLARVMARAISEPKLAGDCGARARSDYQQRYTPSSHLDALLKIYSEAIVSAHGRQR